MLSLTGTVEILWNSPEMHYFNGAQRLWIFHLKQGYWLKNVLSLRWQLQDYSPNTLLTGNWKEAEAVKKAEAMRNTWQPYQVVKQFNESKTIKSFYLQPPAGQKPNFKAGQYITLKANINGQEQIRTYTVSNAPGEDFLRISVKREPGSEKHVEGVFSNFLHRQMQTGDSLLAKAPKGDFYLSFTQQKPIVMIAAGIGITPMLAMIRHALFQGIRSRNMPSILLLACARNDSERAFISELKQLEAQSSGSFRVLWIMTRPEAHLQLGNDYHFQGRLNPSLLANHLSDQDITVYLCGPESFMQQQYNHLRALDIADAAIHAESFGPAAIKRDRQINDTQHKTAETAVIYFRRADVELIWNKADGNLLEFAEAHGLKPEYGCRNRQCGACKTKLISGKVCYDNDVSAQHGEHEVLLCSAMPAAMSNDESNRVEIEL